MIFKTQQFGMRVSAYALGMIFWMLLKLRLPESQKTHYSFQSYIGVPGEPCSRAFLLECFSEQKVKQSLFWQSCMRAVIQFVGVSEHNKSFNRTRLLSPARSRVAYVKTQSHKEAVGNN